METRACINGNCGTLQTGGWTDYGRLEVPDGNYISLSGDPANFANQTRPARQYPAGDIPSQRNGDSTWYGSHPITNPVIRFPMAGPINSKNPSQELNYCELEGKAPFACKQNGAGYFEVHVVTINLNPQFDQLDGKADGIVNYDGYVDRYGKIVNNCNTVGLDCIPLKIHNLPFGYYQYRDDNQGIQLYSFDTSPGALGKGSEWWIRY